MIEYILIAICFILIAMLYKTFKTITDAHDELLYRLRDAINELKFPPREKEITCTHCDSDFDGGCKVPKKSKLVRGAFNDD